MIEHIKRLQEAINRIGLGGSVLSLPTPRMLALPDPGSEKNKPHENFLSIVDDPDLVAVTRDLFVSGFYSQAVDAAYKLLDKEVQRVSKQTASGTKLMESVFSPNSPIVPLNSLGTQSEKDEQSGYHRLFTGSVLGIRNPCAHELDWFDEPEPTLEVLVLCQHLLRKLRAAPSYVAAAAKTPKRGSKA